jgi:hypothetical protein
VGVPIASHPLVRRSPEARRDGGERVQVQRLSKIDHCFAMC